MRWRVRCPPQISTACGAGPARTWAAARASFAAPSWPSGWTRARDDGAGDRSGSRGAGGCARAAASRDDRRARDRPRGRGGRHPAACKAPGLRAPRPAPAAVRPRLRAPLRRAGRERRRRAPHRDDGHGLVTRRAPRAHRAARARDGRARRPDPRHGLPRAPALGPPRAGFASGGSHDDRDASAARVPEAAQGRGAGPDRGRRARELLRAAHARARGRAHRGNGHRAASASVAGALPRGRRSGHAPR